MALSWPKRAKRASQGILLLGSHGSVSACPQFNRPLYRHLLTSNPGRVSAYGNLRIGAALGCSALLKSPWPGSTAPSPVPSVSSFCPPVCLRASASANASVCQFTTALDGSVQRASSSPRILPGYSQAPVRPPSQPAAPTSPYHAGRVPLTACLLSGFAQTVANCLVLLH